MKIKTTVIAGAILILAGTVTFTANAQTNTNTQPSPQTEDSLHREIIETFNQGKKWTMAFYMFANAHTNQLPVSFKEVKESDTNAPDADIAQAHWEILSRGNLEGITNKNKTILFREKEARRLQDGKLSKIYLFVDGHAQEIQSSDGNFAVVEKQFGFLTQSENKDIIDTQKEQPHEK